ncbi:fusion protein [Halobacteriales archaeon QS_1_68_20]|nr:MAG: fusion protein [Halobacteriales archaeon QS_1_68_20]
MSRLDPVDPSETDEETRQFLERFEDEEMEYLPHGLQIMAHRPEIARTFVDFRSAVYGGEVDNELKLMVGHLSSYVRGCNFCQAHTGCHLDLQADVEDEKVRAVRNFEDDDRFTDRERAALRLARDASKIPNQVEEEHFEDLREYFTDPEILEIVGICCLYGFLNCFNETMATTLEEVPRDWAEDTLADLDWQIGRHA